MLVVTERKEANSEKRRNAIRNPHAMDNPAPENVDPEGGCKKKKIRRGMTQSHQFIEEGSQVMRWCHDIAGHARLPVNPTTRLVLTASSDSRTSTESGIGGGKRGCTPSVRSLGTFR